MTDYTEPVRARLRGTMAEFIGMDVTYADPTRVAGELTMRPDLSQPYGYIHGGAIMTLLDTLAGMASALNVPVDKGFLTVEFKVNFLRSVREGKVLGEATPVHIGGKTHVWQVVARDEAGRQLALATLTQLVIDLRPDAKG